MIASFSNLSAPEIELLPRGLTLFLFPVGGLEQHGPHLPVGTKLFQAEAWAKALADELQSKLPVWNFILMPLLPVSVDSVTNRFALNVRAHVVRDAMVDQCEELKRLQFQNFAAVSAHATPKQLSALEDAAKIVSRKPLFGRQKAQFISVTGALIDAKEIWDSPMIALPKEHAGAFDTGFMLSLKPELVAPDYKNLQGIAKPQASVGRFMNYLKHNLDGYWGKPNEASVENTRLSFRGDVRILVEKMLPWLEKGKGQGIFNSGYRYFPVNGSFFKAYLLGVIFFVCMLIWVIWGVRDAFDK